MIIRNPSGNSAGMISYSVCYENEYGKKKRITYKFTALEARQFEPAIRSFTTQLGIESPREKLISVLMDMLIIDHAEKAFSGDNEEIFGFIVDRGNDNYRLFTIESDRTGRLNVNRAPNQVNIMAAQMARGLEENPDFMDYRSKNRELHMSNFVRGLEEDPEFMEATLKDNGMNRFISAFKRDFRRRIAVANCSATLASNGLPE